MKSELTTKTVMLGKPMAALLPMLFTATSFAASQSSVVEVPVVDSKPIVEVVTQRIPYETCRDERVRVVEHSRGNVGRTLVGATLGGAVANVLARNSSKQDVITGVGAVLGGTVGYDRSRQRGHQDSYYVNEEVCSTEYELRESERVRGYRVSYEYGGAVYETRTDYDPGATMAVRVNLQPLP